MDVNRLGYFITDIGRNCQIPAFEKPTIIALEVISAQRIEDVLPAFRSINEPLESLLASYTPAEVEALLTRSPFRHWKINAGMAWLFIWGSKS